MAADTATSTITKESLFMKRVFRFDLFFLLFHTESCNEKASKKKGEQSISRFCSSTSLSRWLFLRTYHGQSRLYCTHLLQSVTHHHHFKLSSHTCCAQSRPRGFFLRGTSTHLAGAVDRELIRTSSARSCEAPSGVFAPILGPSTQTLLILRMNFSLRLSASATPALRAPCPF